MKTYHRVLTIAGSDSGGAAGIQADIKTLSALGCFATSAITAVTAQNTCEVLAIHPIPVKMVKQQIKAVLDDIGVDALKIGMLYSVEVAELVVQLIEEYQLKNVVFDPVMIATSGEKLIRDGVLHTIRQALVPLATVVTPNLPEAVELVGFQTDDYKKLAEKMYNLGAKNVLLKGGHAKNTLRAVDIFYDGHQHDFLDAPRFNTKNTHGTGCTLSSAIAAFLAHQQTPKQAVLNAKKYISGTISEGKNYKIGHGHGAVHHFFKFW